jgi:CheY-like chemotaxis protein
LNAGDGQEILDIVVGNPDIEVVLMDLQLPVMDGYSAAQKIREFRLNVIILAQTAYGLMDEKERIMNSGFDDYIIKPIIS